MRTRAPLFIEVRFARASYCKCLTLHLPRCAVVHTHIGQPHAPATLRAHMHQPRYMRRNGTGDTCTRTPCAPSEVAHVRAHSHAPYSLSDRIFIEQEQPKAAHNIFRLRGAKPALIPQPMWLMYHVRS